MKIREHRALTGPNRFSPYPTITMVLDIQPYADKPTDRIPGFRERLLELMPTLREHRCSSDQPGGLVDRLREGTYLGHVVEHVAIELQCLAGVHVGFGKTRSTDEEGVYHLVYRYRDEASGMKAGRIAVELVEAVAEAQPFDLDDAIDELEYAHEGAALGPSTEAIVREARRRNIPVFRLNEASYLQLGHGAKSQRIQASLTGRTSCIGAEIADDKERTKQMLGDAGLPVPAGRSVEDLAHAQEVADDIGYPVVVKPLMGNHGRGITTGVRNAQSLAAAYDAAQAVHPTVMLEKHLEGNDYRVLVINHRFVAAARRDPAQVVGDGQHTVQQLVDITNSDPRRGEGHDKVMTRIRLDEHSVAFLATQGLTPQHVPAAGQAVRLKGTANLSAGGTACDVTGEVHPQVRAMCERASRLIGLDLMGIDIVAPDLRQPLDGRGGIVEVNAAPGLRMHAQPSEGRPRNIGAPIIDMLFPHGDGRIPVVGVTGTNGKTTTVRLIAHILEVAGAHVGLATTSGVEIDGHVAVAGDYSGPDGARQVLTDPLVDHAVLEIARGGILRRGLGVDQLDVGVFLNVASDHLGEGGVDTVEDLADVKAVVVESVARHGTAVINADDPLVLARARDLRCGVTLISLDPDNAAVDEHITRSGTAVVLAGDEIVVRDNMGDDPVGHVADIPITFGGTARFNIQNALAAVAACRALGVRTETIQEGLETFVPSPQQLPGRLNLIDMGSFRVLVDYGHNVPAIKAVAPVVRHLTGRRAIAMANASGNRRDEDIVAFGRELAGLYSRLVLCDPDPRGRKPGETMALMRQGATAGGLGAHDVEEAGSEDEAIRRVLEQVQPGDLVVLQVDNVRRALELVHEVQRSLGLNQRPVEHVEVADGLATRPSARPRRRTFRSERRPGPLKEEAQP